MDRARTMERRKKICGGARRRIDGRHPIWRELLQRGCFFETRTVRARLVRRCAAGNAFQRRQVYPKMGTKLGNSNLQLGRDAESEFRLVAAACSQRGAEFSCLPNRSHPRLLPDLRVSMAAAAEQKVS